VRLASAAAACRERGVRAVEVAADLADPEAPARLVAAATRAFGRLDVVVANAMWDDPRPLEHVSLGGWDRTMRVTLTAPMLLAQAALEPMRAQGSGSIVFISSMRAVAAGHGTAAYDSAKAALFALTRSIAVDYGRDGIRCNCVSPGLVMSERAQEWLDGEPWRREAMEAVSPVGPRRSPASSRSCARPRRRSSTARSSGPMGGRWRGCRRTRPSRWPSGTRGREARMGEVSEASGGRIEGVFHATVIVSDLDRSLGFYRDLLGFRVSYAWEHDPTILSALTGYPRAAGRAAILECADGTELEVAELREPRGRAAVEHRWEDAGINFLAFRVQGIDALVKRLAAAGTRINGPIVAQTLDDGSVVRVVYCFDPDGVTLTLVELPAGHRTLESSSEPAGA
jgi:NAD(P)-dependent dehydrogenase (short-subunit alcohol dehydrogenase family)/catechol 2,3-dioxygenase-like lactoylglutathione lyase family enzyme